MTGTIYTLNESYNCINESDLLYFKEMLKFSGSGLKITSHPLRVGYFGVVNLLFFPVS